MRGNIIKPLSFGYNDYDMIIFAGTGVVNDSPKNKGLTKRVLRAIICKHSGSAPEYRGVEQLEARRAHNPEVVGSSPASATRNRT